MQFDFVGLAFRWMHILAAIAAVGGMIFLRLALMPSIGVLSDDARKSLHEAVRSRWSKVVMAAIVLLLVSGLYNVVVTATRNELPAYYMPFFAVKFLLSLGIFFISSALVGRAPAFEPIRRNARFWLTLNLILAIALVCMAGVLRIAPKSPRSSQGSTASALDASTHAASRISNAGAHDARCGSWLSRIS
jgi:putative copper export protein